MSRAQLFALAGFLELLTGLALSITVGLTVSWNIALPMALMFFLIGNVLFFIAFQKSQKS